MLDEHTVFQRRAAIENRAVDRAAVLVDAAELNYFGVNRVGARIWQLLEAPRNVPQLVDALLQEFSVEPAICRRETEAFLRQLIAKKLVVEVR